MGHMQCNVSDRGWGRGRATLSRRATPGGDHVGATDSRRVWKLRQRFPDLLIVMQNATGAFTRNGSTHGVLYRTLLDGISHEEVYSNGGDAQARQEMLAWKSLGLGVAGRPFWLAVEDYAGACSSSKKSSAQTLRSKADVDGLSSYVTDESGQQQRPCYWSDL